MEKNFPDHSNVLIMNKFSVPGEKEWSDCEITTIYDKPFLFDKPMECALFDVVLPANLRIPVLEGYFFLKLSIILDWGDTTSRAEASHEAEEFSPQPEHFQLKNKFFTYDDLKSDIEDKFKIIIEKISKYYERYHKNILNNWFRIHESFYISSKPLLIFDTTKDQHTIKFTNGFLSYDVESQVGKFVSYEIELSDSLIKSLKASKNTSLIVHPSINFENQDHRNQGQTIYSFDDIKPWTPDIIYTYCDVISPSYINDKHVNLLRNFRYKKNENDLLNKKIFYRPMRITEFNSITIDLRDISLHNLYFNEGLLTVTLILRPISPKI